jgi:LEA14-like dessication related protein
MKRNFVRFGVSALLAAAIIFGFSTCETLPDLVNEPVVSFNDITLRGISFEGADLLARVNVENTNPFSIPFPETDWEFFISDASFLKGTIKSGPKLAANSVSAVEIPLSVPYEGLYSAVSNLLCSDEAPYKVKVGLRFPLPVIREKTFTAEFSGTLPLPKAPALSFSGVQLKSLSSQRVELVLNFAVENKNAFAISLDKLDYALAVNNSPWASGSAGAARSLPARKTTAVPVTVTINALSLVSEIVGMAAGGSSPSYTCGGEAALSPALPGLAPLSLNYNYSGNLNLKR